MNLCALQKQQPLRDLARLSGWAKGNIAWLEPADLAETSEPAVIVGSWLQEEPGEAREIIRKRSQQRATTLVVPRLPNLDFASHVDAPAPINLKLASFDSVTFDGTRAFGVPGQTTIDSPLSHGRWAVSQSGEPVVLAFRPNEDAGWIVFCTASVCGRGIGLEESAQLGLLEAILTKAALSQPKAAAPKAEAALSPLSCDDLGAILGEQTELVPVFLALLMTSGDRDPAALSEAARTLGLRLREDLNLGLLPDCSPTAIEKALIEQGWKAYVRRVREIRKEEATA